MFVVFEYPFIVTMQAGVVPRDMSLLLAVVASMPKPANGNGKSAEKRQLRAVAPASGPDNAGLTEKTGSVILGP